MQTIVKRYDPVSRRVIDIRLGCIPSPVKTVPASSYCGPCGDVIKRACAPRCPPD